MNYVVLIVVAAVLAVGVWCARRLRYDFKITVRGGEARCRGAIAQQRRADIQEFFQRDVRSSASLTVVGRWNENGQLSLHIDGPIDGGTRQRIRNYLLAILS